MPVPFVDGYFWSPGYGEGDTGPDTSTAPATQGGNKSQEKRWAVRPLVKLEVNHRDVTADFSPYLQTFTFTDHVKGEADGLEIQLADRSGKWLEEWYPVKTTTLSAWVGYDGMPLLACGEFSVDEIEITSPPQEVRIRALGTSHKKALRTRTHRAFEGKSLSAIVADFASRHAFTVVGTIPDVTWTRLTQAYETDLTFLRRISEEHGLVFQIKGTQLVFHDVEQLEAQTAILQIHPSDCSRFHIRDKVSGVEAGQAVNYFQGDLKELQAAEVELAETSPGADAGRKRKRTESKAHSQRLAKAALRLKHGWAREASLSLPGDTRLVAGGNVELLEFGAVNGLWAIVSARHRVDRHSGYVTELEIRHVQS